MTETLDKILAELDTIELRLTAIQLAIRDNEALVTIDNHLDYVEKLIELSKEEVYLLKDYLLKDEHE